MKKTIPFDIKYRPQVESGEMKVETEGETPVEILKWDADKNYPLIVCIQGCAYNYTTKGVCVGAKSNLVLVTEEEEPELTEFERTVAEYVYAGCDLDSMLKQKTVVKNIKGISQELLDLAIRQIEDELRGSIASSSKIEAAYALGCIDTEERLLKDD